MKVLILDAYNVIHAIPELERMLDRSLEAAREALIARCRVLCQARGDIGEIHLIFDGSQAEEAPALRRGAGVSVWFTPKKEEADERILRMIKQAEAHAQFVIVSNDTYVFNNSRAHGAQVMSSAAFQEWLKPGPGRKKESRIAGETKTLSGRQAREINEAYLKDLERRESERKMKQNDKGGSDGGT